MIFEPLPPATEEILQSVIDLNKKYGNDLKSLSKEFCSKFYKENAFQVHDSVYERITFLAEANYFSMYHLDIKSMIVVIGVPQEQQPESIFALPSNKAHDYFEMKKIQQRQVWVLRWWDWAKILFGAIVGYIVAIIQGK